MEALPCPRCRTELTPKRVPDGSAWTCSLCKGASFNLALLCQQIPDAVSVLWTHLSETPPARARCCPSCSAPMCACTTAGVDLDICRLCQLVWFDPGEAEDFGATMELPLSEEARASVALAQVEAVAEGASIQKKIAEIRSFLFGLARFRDPNK